MVSDIWLRTIVIVRKETRCRHIGYSFWLTARVLLYAPSHRQDNTYHGLCYTSRGALAGMRNSSMGPPHEGSIRRPTAPWANALPLSYVPLLRDVGEVSHLIIPSSEPVQTTSGLTATMQSMDRGWPGKRSLMLPHSPQLKMLRTPLPVPHTTFCSPCKSNGTTGHVKTLSYWFQWLCRVTTGHVKTLPYWFQWLSGYVMSPQVMSKHCHTGSNGAVAMSCHHRSCKNTVILVPVAQWLCDVTTGHVKTLSYWFQWRSGYVMSPQVM